MKKYVLMLDLNNNPALITAYINHHKNVWPEIQQSIKDSGILNMEIYNLADRLFMIIEADDHFTFEKKAAMDAANPIVQKWETLMEQFQKVSPGEASTEKWKLMDKIFELAK